MTFAHLNLSSYPLFLAPMEDVTNSSFRYLCKYIGGVDVVYTEFISSDGLRYNTSRVKKKIKINDFERPIGIQIYGHIPENMVYAAQVVEEFQPDFIDLNLGCPAKKISNRGAGSGLLKNLPLLFEIAEKVIKAVDTPVTAKARLGWDENNINILEVALTLQNIGITGLVIHGRTRAQMFKGTANWDYIGYVKNHPQIKIPIIGNGDVTTPERAKECFDKYKVDGIMIGRAAIGHPWIFKEIKHYLLFNEKLPPLSFNEKIDYLKKLLSIMVEENGEKWGVIKIKCHYANFFKGIPGIKELKVKLLQNNNYKENLEILDFIKEKYANVFNFN
ncbi:MAG: tRNA dihydrouridine synthase DusB [Bacteroidales bacterium]|nr:tRNA dihydrouridine synthase DusB [Bacteroidales bacterium]